MALTDDQISQRLGYITSSVAAAAFGEHEKMTPLDAWMQITGRLPKHEKTKAMKRGDMLEDLVLDYPCDVLGLTRHKAPFVKHPSLEWAADSADAIYSDDRVVTDRKEYAGEAKTVSGTASKNWGEEGTDDIPTGALVQSHWHLIHHPKAIRCIVPVLIGGFNFEFRIYYVNRDEEFSSTIIEDLARWHRDYVVADKPPPATASRDSAHILLMHPRSLGKFIEPSDELEQLAREKEAYSAARKDAEEREEIAKTRIRELLGDHEGSIGNGWKITWKNNKDSTKTDWKSIVNEMKPPEDLIRKHTRVVPGPRVLRVTVKG
jgi:predicted phage-related endonuclease